LNIREGICKNRESSEGVSEVSPIFFLLSFVLAIRFSVYLMKWVKIRETVAVNKNIIDKISPYIDDEGQLTLFIKYIIKRNVKVTI
jgi:hypothetical protein